MTSQKTTQRELIQAINTLSDSIRELTKREERNGFASDIRQWGNLTFGGMVLVQIFADKINATIAGYGVALLIGSYLIAYGVSKGGGKL